MRSPLSYVCRYVVQELDWLHEQLDEAEDDYFVFDLPGQIELYSHLPVMRQACPFLSRMLSQIVDALRSWDFNICSVFLLDTHFMLEAEKFVAGTLTALSAMVTLETPAVNVLTKVFLSPSQP